MRQPKPWYRKQTRTWYVQIGTKQTNLGKNKPEAWNKYHEIMQHTGRYVPGEQSGVVELLQRYIAWGDANLAETTVRKIRFHLHRFIDYIGDALRVDGLKPLHIRQWLDDNYRERSDTCRHTAVSVVQSAMRWARDHGHIEVNPID